MSSACLRLAAALVLLLAAPAAARELRVCADPNNLPFSNEKGVGLENRLATLVARNYSLSVGEGALAVTLVHRYLAEQ